MLNAGDLVGKIMHRILTEEIKDQEILDFIFYEVEYSDQKDYVFAYKLLIYYKCGMPVAFMREHIQKLLYEPFDVSFAIDFATNNLFYNPNGIVPEEEPTFSEEKEIVKNEEKEIVKEEEKEIVETEKKEKVEDLTRKIYTISQAMNAKLDIMENNVNSAINKSFFGKRKPVTAREQLIEKMKNLKFNDEQISEITKALDDNISYENVLAFADPNISADNMKVIRNIYK